MPNERDFVLHSWCVPGDWNAPTVVGGRGAKLLLEDGREILDMSSLVECSNLGHQHPKLVAALKAQADKLAFVTAAWGAESRRALAERLLEVSGFEGGRVFFTLGGGDANENAVRIARHASKKPRGLIITRDRSYHGATYMPMALSGDARTAHQVDAEAWGVRHVPPPYAYRCPWDSKTPEECGRRARAGRRRHDRHGRRRPRRGRADGSQRRQQRHRPAGQFLAGAPAGHARARHAPGRGRGHERLRPLRRLVRMAAPRRGEPPGPHDGRQGAHGRSRAARRRRHQRRRIREDRARDVLRRPHLLRPPALLRRRRRGHRCLPRREAHRALATAWRADVRGVAEAGRAPFRDRRRPRRSRPVRGRRAGRRPRDPGADRALGCPDRRP